MQQQIVLIEQTVLDMIVRDIKDIKQKLILNTNTNENDEIFISKKNAAKKLDCDEQTIDNFHKEGRIKRYGRGKFIRYKIEELKNAMEN
ncbi:MAG: hypothetical protein Q7S59_06890 [Sulfurimonas sp.]|nr:hypothetical protein [Sulfurimonas sp.]